MPRFDFSSIKVGDKVRDPYGKVGEVHEVHETFEDLVNSGGIGGFPSCYAWLHGQQILVVWHELTGQWATVRYYPGEACHPVSRLTVLEGKFTKVPVLTVDRVITDNDHAEPGHIKIGEWTDYYPTTIGTRTYDRIADVVLNRRGNHASYLLTTEGEIVLGAN